MRCALLGRLTVALARTGEVSGCELALQQLVSPAAGPPAPRLEGAEFEGRYDAGAWFANLAATHVRGRYLTNNVPLYSNHAIKYLGPVDGPDVDALI